MEVVNWRGKGQKEKARSGGGGGGGGCGLLFKFSVIVLKIRENKMHSGQTAKVTDISAHNKRIKMRIIRGCRVFVFVFLGWGGKGCQEDSNNFFTWLVNYTLRRFCQND